MKKIIYILSAAFVLATACTREMTLEQSVRPGTTIAANDGDMALVTFKVTVPETSLYAISTRSSIGELSNENSIADGELYVAVFGAGEDEKVGGNLQHFLKANLKSTIDQDVDMTISGETITRAHVYEYEVLLPLSNDPLVLDFMVGACDSNGNPYTLDHPLPVKYEAELMPTLFSMDGNAAYWQRVRIDGVYPKYVNGQPVMTQYKDDGGAMLSDVDQDYIADDID